MIKPRLLLSVSLITFLFLVHAGSEDEQKDTEKYKVTHTMASSTSHQSSFKCSICLDQFTDPVSTSCGHNFCKVCINNYWDTTDIIQCPLCQQNFKKRPQLRVNVMLRDLIEQTNVQNVPEEGSQTQDILCDVCTGEGEKAVKSCLHCEKSLCSEHLRPHRDDAELKTHELLDPVSRLKER